MPNFSDKYISIADLYLAYRKAKADAFYDNTHPCALAYAEYEQKLENNLKQLYSKIAATKPVWMHDVDFLVGYLYVPKSLDESCWEEKDSVHYRAIDPIEDWNSRFERHGSQKISSKYRLVITTTVNFQIISALWILKVGHQFEEALDQTLSYGNRLRRYRPGHFSPSSASGRLNRDSLGLFQPYFSAYKRWRENGLKTMQKSLKEGKSINAITMDISSFYHKVSPKFLLREEFLDEINVVLGTDEKLFTSQLIMAINSWYALTPDFDGRPEGALPVGLSASKVISNVLLHQFDREMVAGLSPLYYGRYVDDIFLVINAPEGASDGDEILTWIQKNVSCVAKQEDGTLKVEYPYANDSELIFARDKQKIFCLSSVHGLDLIDQIFSQIRKQSSEYRMLPDVPRTAPEMASRALLAASSASLEADSLRKADVVSVRRLGFSLLLGDVESYAKDLNPVEWSSVRSEFYGLVHRHLLTPKGLFEFSNYLHRVFCLMISCGDFNDAMTFINSLNDSFGLLYKTTTDGTRDESKYTLCKDYFIKTLVQSAFLASTGRSFTNWNKLSELLKRLNKIATGYGSTFAKKMLMAKSRQLLFSDLGSRPYKEYWYYSQDSDMNNVKVPKALKVRKVLRLAAIRNFRKVAELKSPHWPALAFPTRPLTIQEIAIISPKVLEDNFLFKQAIKGLRGAQIGSTDEIGFAEIEVDQMCKILSVPKHQNTKMLNKIRIALTSVKTSDKQWEKAIKGTPDRSLARYQILHNLINRIIMDEIVPDYIVFPECSIPRRWAFNIAHKLAKAGISMICGLEYYPEKNLSNKLRNDSFVSLVTNWPGYKSNIIYVQPKLEPAHKEKSGLKANGKQLFNPKTQSVLSICGNTQCKLLQQYHLPIYDHGGYYFGVLICSDMTNIENRSHFQGKVDSLFVLEWNPDIDTFSFLVEGAAHDIHTFVIQVNNREYGDSRIRAPYKETHRRDSIRVKGGISDFYVVGEIEYLSLRKFQKLKKTPVKAVFKPVPIGFKIASWRK